MLSADNAVARRLIVRIAASRPLVALLTAVAVPLSLVATVATGSAGASTGAKPAPPSPYSCGEQANMTVSGTFGDAGLIGWSGDKDGVVACLGAASTCATART